MTNPQPEAATAGKFRRYDHLERVKHADVADISFGVVHVFPKIDGTNASVWAAECPEGGLKVECGSRTRTLRADADNAGFYAWVHSDCARAIALRTFVLQFPHLTVYGEWLVPHTLKTYREDAWKRFYVFDVFDHTTGRYVPFETYGEPMAQMGIDVIMPLAIIENPSDNQLAGLRDETNTFLIRDDAGVGEGIVLKNYCPTPDQLMLTSDLRWVPAGMLRPGDGLLAFDENIAGRRTRRFRQSTVIDAEPGRDEVFEIELSDGTVLKGTADHPWLACPKASTYAWKKTRELRSGWKLRRLLDTWSTDESYNAGWLAGFYDGEGCVTGSTHDAIQVQTSQVPGPVLDEVKRRLRAAEFEYYETGGGNSSARSIYISGGKKEELRFLGMIRPGRLLRNLDLHSMGTIKSVGCDMPRVVAVRSIGDQDIIQLGTTSRTFIQEGFAAHNSWQNKHGRQPWAKIVRNEFKEDNRKVFGMKPTEGEKLIERDIVAEFCTPEFIRKEWHKVVYAVAHEAAEAEHESAALITQDDNGCDVFDAFIEASRHKILPRFLGTTYLTFVDEEIRTVVKKMKNPVIDFSKLQKLITLACKRTMSEYF